MTISSRLPIVIRAPTERHSNAAQQRISRPAHGSRKLARSERFRRACHYPRFFDRTMTASPFPGMDPYLEYHWRSVHHRLITYLGD
ncbi:MAG TPA: hypothetical protein DDZ51_00095 [Planctomycetaceae bacterium]|nr:hypothetical protein [Planctomycetaceae bacterium]